MKYLGLICLFMCFVSYTIAQSISWEQKNIETYSNENKIFYLHHYPTKITAHFGDVNDISTLQKVKFECLEGEGISCTTYTLTIKSKIKEYNHNNIYMFESDEDELSIFYQNGKLCIVLHQFNGVNIKYVYNSIRI